MHPHFHQQVAYPFFAGIRQAFAAQAEYGTALRSFGNFQVQGFVQTRHFDAHTQGRLGEGDGGGVDKVLPLAGEGFIFLHTQHDVQVARRAAVHAEFAFAAQTQTRAVIDARRNTHSKIAFLLNYALPLALGAGVRNGKSLPAAGRAGHADLEKALGVAHLAAAPALFAGFGLGAFGRARTFAFVARHVTGNGDGNFGALGGLLKGNGQIVAQIGSGLGPGAARAGAEAEQIAENIAEL